MQKSENKMRAVVKESGWSVRQGQVNKPLSEEELRVKDKLSTTFSNSVKMGTMSKEIQVHLHLQIVFQK